MKSRLPRTEVDWGPYWIAISVHVRSDRGRDTGDVVEERTLHGGGVKNDDAPFSRLNNLGMF